MLGVVCNITVTAETPEEYQAAKLLVLNGVQYEGLVISFDDEEQSINVTGTTSLDVSERL